MGFMAVTFTVSHRTDAGAAQGGNHAQVTFRNAICEPWRKRYLTDTCTPRTAQYRIAASSHGVRLLRVNSTHYRAAALLSTSPPVSAVHISRNGPLVSAMSRPSGPWSRRHDSSLRGRRDIGHKEEGAHRGRGPVVHQPQRNMPLITKGARIRFDNNDCRSLPSENTHSDRGAGRDYCVFASSRRRPRARGIP